MLHCRKSCVLAAVLLGALNATLPAQSSHDQTRARANLIVITEEAGRIDPSTTLLELARRRLPLVVEQGRFAGEDGPSDTCVYSRRSSMRGLRSETPFQRSCAMITAFVDGIRISNAANYLMTTPVSSLESVELIRSSDANFRYGFAAGGGEALEIWTRGRGPHAPRV